MTEDLDRLLQRDSIEKRTSVNALVVGMFEKYAEWDRFTAKFGFVSCSRAFLRALIDSTSEAELVRRAKDLGDRQPKEFTYLWFKKLDADAFQRFISLTSKYASLFEGDVEIDGRILTFNARHEYGEKWSRFLESYFGQAARSFGLVPQLEHTSDHMILRVQIPSG